MEQAYLVNLTTKLSVAEALRRLSAVTTPISGCFGYALATTFGKDPHLVGQVTKTGIILALARPLSNNSAKPVFIGSFEQKGGDTLLRGHFEYNCFRKVFFWVSGTVFGAAEAVIVFSLFAPENHPLLSLKNLLAVSLLPTLQVAALLFTRFTTDTHFEADRAWIETELQRVLMTES